MTLQRLSPLDARWLLMESDNTPMHAGALLTFKIPSKARKDFLQQMATRFRATRKLAHPWNLRLKCPDRSSIAPKVERVDSIDLDYHFRHSALPTPGGERELGILVSRLHSHPLDKQKPLWEMHIIEGLENKRFAVYFKYHPALLHGIDVAPLINTALNDSAQDKENLPFWAIPLEGDHEEQSDRSRSSHDSPAAEVADKVSEAAEYLLHTGKTLSKAIKGTFVEGFKAPRLAPRSSLNSAVNSQRRFATQQYDFERLKKLAAVSDCTPNTILTYVCGSAIRRFFKEYNALPDKPLIASGSSKFSHSDGDTNHQVSTSVGVSLATHIADPIKRLESVKRSMLRGRDHLLKLPKEAQAPYAIMNSLPVIASQVRGIGRLVPSIFNVGISRANIADTPLYFEGAKLEAIYPMAHLMQYSALSFDCALYAGTVNIGITGARDTLPRLQRIAVYMDQALNELENLLLKEASA